MRVDPRPGVTNVSEQRSRPQRTSVANGWQWLYAGRPFEQQRALLAIVALTAVAAAIRSRGFSDLGLFRDDAWVALSARTGLGTAWHMWVTAPGFSFLEREFILIGPHATWWDQLPAYVAGVLCVPAIYAVVRYFRIGRIGGIVAAVLVCVSPVCVVYSTRVKEYPFDFLLTCALLMAAEHARRTWGGRQFATCAAVSVGAFLVSASTAVVIVGAWLALGLLSLGDQSRRKVAVRLGVAAAAGSEVVALVFYGHISPALNRFWTENSGFIVRSSPSQFVNSLFHTGWNLLSGLFGFAALPAAYEVLIIVAWLALALVGIYRDRALAIPGLVVLLAFVGSAVHVVPLGTGRTDEYLYPVLLLLPLAGAVRVVPVVTAFVDARLGQARRAVGVTVAVVSVVLSFLLIGHEAKSVPAYPGVAVQQLAAAIHRVERPGDHIFVNEVMRYPWALYEADPLRIQLGGDWSTNFTVVSTDRGVFIDPSEDYEGDQHPVQWAKAMSRYQRVWYVWSPPLSVFSFSYGALIGAGWHVVRTINAPGCSAYLLVRGT